MKNSLSDLNNHLFAALERLNDEDLSKEDLASECDRAQAVVGLADAIVRNADTQLRALRLLDDCGLQIHRADVPGLLLESKKDES